MRKSVVRKLLFLALVLVAIGCVVVGLKGLVLVPAPPAVRAVSFGYEDVSDADFDWARAERRLRAINANAVALSAGRVEWTPFMWEEFPDAYSADSAVAEDLLARALSHVGDREVTLTIDAFVPRLIEEEQALAGVDSAGRSSEFQASASQLSHGVVGDRLVAYAVAVASRYRPDFVALSELHFDDFTFGDDDLADFRRFSGRKDWPRLKGGQIDVSHDSIARWRSSVLSGLVARMREGFPPGVGLVVDVRASWDSPTGDRAESGHDYEQLLASSELINVWNYFGLSARGAGYTDDLARGLNASVGSGRYALSIGLWADDDRTISARELSRALRLAAKAGARSVSVTPASKLSEQHWTVLEQAWAQH
ncbi:hypothetical protein P4N68_06020 [Corynebacterium felinum]|uniref:Glycosyl hydrolase-like 10 domain-containing protein n=1 Tax=Corynebacterium felinum TaxID=131318 RepID=A0ABU2B4K2_9CORY|nr:hypothetical protein [Corynebacterium felinum]MDF5820635.1 hypothetical protein [Corynebacterium felinum]MDR7353542.1 hypothetical protein [Corynebacterium felinum]WJY95723.1 hypothetical protein CFELI_10625 [Corynebacterium felinum]